MITVSNVMNVSPQKDILLFIHFAPRHKPVRRAHLIKKFVKASPQRPLGCEYIPKDINDQSLTWVNLFERYKGNAKKYLKALKYENEKLSMRMFKSLEKTGSIDTSKKFASIGCLNKALQRLKDLDLIISEKQTRDYPVIRLTELGKRIIADDNIHRMMNTLPTPELFDEFYSGIDKCYLRIIRSRKFKPVIQQMIQEEKKKKASKPSCSSPSSSPAGH